MMKDLKIKLERIDQVLRIEKPLESYPIEQVVIAQKEQHRDCCLCDDAERLQISLLNHFTSNHPNFKDEKINNVCSCPESFELQAKLVDHLLRHVFKKFEVKVEPEIEIFEKEEVENTFEQDTDSNEQDYASDRNDSLFGDEDTNHENLKERNIRCDLCSATYHEKRCLTRHLKAQHDPDNKFKCEKCPQFSFASIQGLRTHNALHKARNLVCDYCGSRFIDKPGLKEHFKKVHFTNKSIATKKPLKVKPPINLKCSECDKTLKNPRQLRLHKLRHDTSQTFTCDYPNCSAKFTVQRNLKSHETTVHKKKMCDQCSMLVPPSKMKRHFLIHHSKDESHLFECEYPECTARLSSRQALINHNNAVHLKLKPLMCEFCSKKFSSTRSLRKHLVRHTNPEKLYCSKCEINFSEPSTLRRHIRRKHSKAAEDRGSPILNFKCVAQGCNKKFEKFRYLQMHARRTHNQSISEQRKSENPFPCPHADCGKSFSKPRYVHEHCCRVHGLPRSITEKIERTCKICEKHFSHRSGWTRHMKKQHPDIDYRE